MKRLARSIVVATLVAATSTGALAGDRHWNRHYYDDHRHHHRHHSREWVAPLIALGIVGAAVSAAAADRERPRSVPGYYDYPPQAYDAPPPAPREVWYYCRSANQYYPYTAHCPEGWQSVPARPRW